MINNRRMPKNGGGALLLAGAAAAFAYYKYSKMSEEQKRSLVTDIKDKGKKLYDQYVPQDVKEMLSKNNVMGGTTDTSGTNNFTV